MKNWIYIIFIGLMGFLASSCQRSLDEDVQYSRTLGKAQLTFTIALEDIDSRSRASWNQNESDSTSVVGTVYENQIDLASEDGLQVFVYDLDGNLLGEVTDMDVHRISDKDNIYRFNGNLEIEDLPSETLKCHLMVYANCTSSTETFEYGVRYIPMWGLKETTLNLAKGELTEVEEPIYLLRAMAKVSVKLHATISKEFDLDSVTIDKYNKKGYVLPAYQTLVNTEEMDLDAVFNPDTTSLGTDLAFSKISDDEFSIYLPEYCNVDEDVSPATISVVIDGKSYTLEFKNYINGQVGSNAYNIVRNHYYQYVITSINTGVEVSFSYQSIPWQDVNNGNLNFGNADGNVAN